MLTSMIRRCEDGDFEIIRAIINDGASAYKGVIPADCWSEPYMPREELRREIDHGVAFWAFEEVDGLAGVMGLQCVDDVTLIRHAYVRTDRQGRGIGGRLLAHLRNLVRGPILIGTWADAKWAIRFYEKHAFEVVDPGQKAQLLQRYWTISERQAEVSVVLSNPVER
jgi:GNAT superfamily N-acetyltransferase